ncbi:hypothetical protein DERP_013872 [Dermatophagoides pteronyssinus]|uniref:Uncharacterized protein n=1 Tax=Dermatophagoides pteronyssinus TaxID=6956 RepID=A0ABQ8J2U9_DERPT|nr:hypothetical protein DERP_013872 [Dermatophagoides pteronyssinus]
MTTTTMFITNTGNQKQKLQTLFIHNVAQLTVIVVNICENVCFFLNIISTKKKKKTVLYVENEVFFPFFPGCPKGYIESNDGKNCIKNIITSQQQYCQQQQQQWQRQQQQLNLPCDPHCSDHSAEQPPQPLEDNDDDQQLEEHYLIDELSSSSSSTPDASNTNIKRMNRKKNKQPSILNAQKFQLEYYGLFFIILIILIPLNIPCK